VRDRDFARVPHRRGSPHAQRLLAATPRLAALRSDRCSTPRRVAWRSESSSNPAGQLLFVPEAGLGLHTVAALGAVAADGDEVQAVRGRLRARANGGRRDTNCVPTAQLDDLVVELDPARASDNDVDLLLLPMAVALLAAETGAGAERLTPRCSESRCLRPKCASRAAMSPKESSTSFRFTTA